VASGACKDKTDKFMLLGLIGNENYNKMINENNAILHASHQKKYNERQSEGAYLRDLSSQADTLKI
jgi:hypothetical protein